MNGKKDRSKITYEIDNIERMYKGYDCITIYEGGDMTDFYKTIKNISIKIYEM